MTDEELHRQNLKALSYLNSMRLRPIVEDEEPEWEDELSPEEARAIHEEEEHESRRKGY